MSTVSATLKMFDAMTGPLKSVTNGMNLMISTMYQMQSATNKNVNIDKSLAAAKKQIASAETDINKAIQDNINSQNKFNNSVSGSSKGFSDMFNKIKSIGAAYLGVQAVHKATQTSDEFVSSKARLNLINDGSQTTEQLQNKVFASAARSRGDYTTMASSVSKLGLLAGDAFKNNDEVIQFTELMQKSFKVSGASTQEQQAGMYQLTQAMAAGKLQGDEFRSIMENAPMLAQAIATYTGKTKGDLKQMSSDGVITADIIKGAMFTAANDINSKFAKMPITFSEIAINIKNKALQAFEPMLLKMNEIANSKGFQTLVNNIIGAMVIASGAIMGVINLVIAISDIITNNWSWIEPIVWGIVWAFVAYNAVAMVTNTIMAIQGMIATATAMAEAMAAGGTFLWTVQQYGLNAALMACPLTWIIVLVIALITVFYAVIGAINHFAGTSISATGVIMGALATAGAFIGNLFMGLLEIAFGLIESWYNWFGAFANFFGNLFNDPVAAVINLFADMADNVLGVLQKIASSMDFIFGSKMASTVKGWRTELSVMAENAVKEYGNGNYKDRVADLDLDNALAGLGVNLERFNYGDAYKTGYDFGENIENSLNLGNVLSNAYKGFNKDDMFSSGIPNIGEVKEVGKVKNKVDISSEDLKTMRELAEMKNIQNFVTLTPVVKVQTGDINNGYDVDTIINRITDSLQTEIASSAEGVFT